jgi:hypothetical protein
MTRRGPTHLRGCGSGLRSSSQSRPPDELKAVFGGPVFTEGARPTGGKGEAAFWLPLSVLFTGARRSELAGLTVDNLDSESFSSAAANHYQGPEPRKAIEDPRFTTSRGAISGACQAWVSRFCICGSQAARGRVMALSRDCPRQTWRSQGVDKGFYTRDRDVANPDKVFHSFRHGFEGALRAGGVGEDVIDALTGHSTKGSVARGCGAKHMVRQFGIEWLVEVISAAKLNGPALSNIQPTHTGKSCA